MRRAGIVTYLIAVVSVVVLCYGTASAAKKDTRKLCADCHKEVAGFFDKKRVHKPVAGGQCTACHNPHASKHKNLIGESRDELCYGCHKKDKLLKGNVVHQPVVEGLCLECHASHSSDKRALLKGAEAELCFGCHKKENIEGKKFVHPEVRKGRCTTCHDPHGSTLEGLIVKNNMCISCHKGGSKTLRTAHSGLNVSGTQCLSCHSPHSSDNRGIIKANVHAPFAEGKCNVCHKQGSKEIVKADYTMCLDCHENSMQSFYKRYSHLMAGKDDNFCADCHTPHASDERALLRDREDKTCWQCHEDTRSFTHSARYIHPDLKKCLDCHVSHGSNARYMLAAGDNTCSMEGCHPSQGRFTHPVGDDAIDPRSREPMNCSTCHNPMGSPEEFILRAGKVMELCIKCHQI
ncbi:MAG TPA: hypothetical protein ENK42_02180 [Deltaproteobacteria bacterium]|nr:hypothetical protein [Deltaproteobacteria bacterium]